MPLDSLPTAIADGFSLLGDCHGGRCEPNEEAGIYTFSKKLAAEAVRSEQGILMIPLVMRVIAKGFAALFDGVCGTLCKPFREHASLLAFG